MSIVSAIVFLLSQSFNSFYTWLGPKRKLNCNRMYMLLPPMHYSKISKLLQYSEISVVSMQKLEPVRAEKSYHILNFLL